MWLELMTALAVSDPVLVDVEVHAEDPQAAENLRGYLLARLVESGAAVTGHDTPGAIVVSVQVEDAGFLATVDAAEPFRVPPAVSRSVQRLELAHLVYQSVAELPERDADVAGSRTVSVELHPSMPPENFQRVVEAVLVELVDGVGVVVSDARPADTRICIGPAGHGFVALRADDGSTCASTWTRLPDHAPGPLLSQLRPLFTPPSPAPTPVDEPAVTPEPTTPRTWIGLDAAAGLAARPPGLDPAAALHIELFQHRGFGGRVGGEVWPSIGTRGSFVDTNVHAGGLWTSPVGRRLRFTTGIGAGVLVHAYAVGAERGSRVDGSFDLHARLGVQLTPRLELGFRVGGGVATRRRTHVEGITTLWERSAFRVLGGLGLAYRWGLS